MSQPAGADIRHAAEHTHTVYAVSTVINAKSLKTYRDSRPYILSIGELSITGLLFVPIKLFYRLDHTHYIFHRCFGLDIVNRIKNKTALSTENLAAA